jgi:hypothetical protein
MNVSEVATLFRGYTDEPDTTFLTDADVSTYLTQGYNEFRTFVSALDPMTYSAKADLVWSDTDEYDLATGAIALLGGTITGGYERLMQIHTLVDITNTSGGVGVIFEPVTSLSALDQASRGYMLSGSVIRLDRKFTGTLRLKYMPEQSATLWSNLAAATYIDDLTMFHDLIALYAYAQYAIRDAAQSPPVMAQINKREFQLVDYVTRRVLHAPQYVGETLASYQGN